MRLDEIRNHPLREEQEGVQLREKDEDPFDNMVSDLNNAPKKGPGRWPGSKEKKQPGTNYSGDKANDRNGYGW